MTITRRLTSKEIPDGAYNGIWNSKTIVVDLCGNIHVFATREGTNDDERDVAVTIKVKYGMMNFERL